MVTCVKCGGEVDIVWTEVEIEVAGARPIPLYTKVAICRSCGCQILYLDVETIDNKIVIMGSYDGETE